MKNTKLRICLLGDATSPHIAAWAQRFTSFGHEVHVISPNNAEIKGVKVHPTKTTRNKYFNFFLTYIKIRKIIRKLSPDIIHAHFLGKFSFLAALCNFHPFVGSIWGSDIALFGEKNPITRLMFKYLLKKCDLIHVHDKATTNFLMKRYNVNGDKIMVFVWGVNPSEFKPITQKKNIHILYLRKSSKKYGTDIYIKAINLVKKKFPKIIFTLLEVEGNLEIQKLIKKYKLERNLKKLKWTSHDNLPKLLNSSLIYVDSFHRSLPGSSFGMTSIEAMACELPVVLADNPGVSEYIKHNYNGLIYKQANYEDLSEAILKLLKNKKLRQRLGKKSRKVVIDKMNWVKNARKVERKYMELTKIYRKPIS